MKSMLFALTLGICLPWGVARAEEGDPVAEARQRAEEAVAAAEGGGEEAGPKLPPVPALKLDEQGIPVVSGVPTDPDGGHWGALDHDYAMEITSSGPSPADLVNRGFYQILLFRSPQASRHFLAALAQDPDCAMAWVGLYLALLERGDELMEARAACFKQAIRRRDAVLPHEQAWIGALGALHIKGVRAFAASLDQIRLHYPGDGTAAVMLPLMLREGYDESGHPRPGQAAGNDLLELLLDRRPGDAVLLHAWLQAKLVSPRPEEAIDQARALLAGEPPSAYLRQAAGMILYRCGHLDEAVDAFEQARQLEEASLRQEGIAVCASPTYFDNLHCLAMALMEAGRRTEALSLSRAAGKLDLPWDVHTNTALREYAFFTVLLESLVQARGAAWKEAREALPAQDHPVFAAGHPAAFFSEAMLAVVEARQTAAEGNADEARAALRRLEMTIAAMGKAALRARAVGLDPHWSEARGLLEYLICDVRAAVGYAAGDPTLADLWWRSAGEREVPGTVRAVPRWPTSAAESKARAIERGGDPATVAEAWAAAVKRRPHSGWPTAGLARAHRRAGNADAAAQTERALQRLWPKADREVRALFLGEAKNSNEN